MNPLTAHASSEFENTSHSHSPRGLNAAVWGEFDPYALLVRVYAPTPSALIHSLPTTPEDALAAGTLESGLYPVPQDWSELLYAANYVHEATHYWQYATRPWTIAVYGLLTQQAVLTQRLIRQLRSSPSLPVRLPLLAAALGAPPSTTLRDWLAAWGTLETAFCAMTGYDSSLAGESFRQFFEAFRRQHRMPHLPEHLFPQVIGNEVVQGDLTLRALNENEAFANEFCFMWQCYGLDVAIEVMKCLYGPNTTPDYGGMFFAEASPGFTFPLVMELATAGWPEGASYTKQHPCWRYIRLAKAVRRGEHPWKNLKAIVDRSPEIITYLTTSASIPDSDESYKTALDRVLAPKRHYLPETRRLLSWCLQIKRYRFHWFAFPTVYLWDIVNSLPMPFVTFGSNSTEYHSLGHLPPGIDSQALLEEVWFVAAARELALSASVTCPVCRLETPGRSESAAPVMSCSGGCAWSEWFSRTWGCYVRPEAI